MPPQRLQHEFYVSPGTKNRVAVLAALPGVEVMAPSRGTINICAKREMAHYKQIHPLLEFHDRSIVNKLLKTPPVTRVAIRETPSKFASMKYRSSASKFKAIIKQHRRKSSGSPDKAGDDTLVSGNEEDDPFDPANGKSKLEEAKEESKHSDGGSEEEDHEDEPGDDDESEVEDEREEEDARNAKAEAADKTQHHTDQSNSSDDSDSGSGSGSDPGSDSDSGSDSGSGSDDTNDSDQSDDSEESEQEGQREEETGPDSVPETLKVSPQKSPKSPGTRVSFAKPLLDTYRNRKIRKVDVVSDADSDSTSDSQSTHNSMKPVSGELGPVGDTGEETEQFYDALGGDGPEEEFETAPDHLGRTGTPESNPEEILTQVPGSELETTPTKTKRNNSASKSPVKPSAQPANASPSPKSPTKESTNSLLASPEKPTSSPLSAPRKRRSVLLDDDDGFGDEFETEFSREKQAEFFLQSDSEDFSDEQPEKEDEKGHPNGDQKGQKAIKEEEAEHTAGAEFDDEFQPLSPRAGRKRGTPGLQKPRDKYNPSKDRLILESAETAKKLSIPLKQLFKELMGTIGHTEFSLQTRLSRLEADEPMRETARRAPFPENVTVADIISKMVNEKSRTAGPRPRSRIPYTNLDDMAIKAFVCDLDPSVRGFYSVYEPFADKYLHHNASSVKGRWAKTLGPRTSEIELLEAKEKFTPEVEEQYNLWLRETYPAIFQS
ncbi:hypothetical protein CJU90_1292 [Yarrowia sp. C11]|nr:hypothetical protein CKK34_0018 [Yarrowia sp. E02]KAG5371278.1 hypothetical protein CJU90_1292 [Yarrowia sp. C11]